MFQGIPSERLQRIVCAVSKSREQGEFTDLTLICEGTKFEVHNVIVCSQSSVFHAACTGNFKEATSGTYEMVDDSKCIVEKMLEFLYTGDYVENSNEPENESTLPISALELHAQLFALADKYNIRQLCDLAAERYISRLKSSSDPLEYLESIPDVYFSTHPPKSSLREVVLRFARDNLEQLLTKQTIREKYDRIAVEVPSFVKDVLDAFIEAPLLGDCFNCGYRQPMLALQARCRKCRRGKDLTCKNTSLL